jgi:hypothetical protein
MVLAYSLLILRRRALRLLPRRLRLRILLDILLIYRVVYLMS